MESIYKLSRQFKTALRGNIEAYVLIGFIFIAVAFYLLVPYQVQKPKLVFGASLMDMQASLFPKLAGWPHAVSVSLAFFRGLRHPLNNPFKGLTRSAALQITLLLIILYIFALIFEPLGYWLSGILISATLSLYLGNRNIFTLILLSVGIPSLIYFVFTRLLLISLPEGILF